MKSFKDIASAETKRVNEQYISSPEQEILIKKLNLFVRRSQVGEDERVSKDVLGAKLRNGEHWGDTARENVSYITSNIGTAMYEKMVDATTRVKPSPEIFAKNSDDDEAAQLLQAAIIQNWDTSKFQQKLKIAALQAGFTRPPLHYLYWDAELKNGIGDINSRIIPAYRTIIDNKTPFISEMEYVGFKEQLTRAKLCMLYPEHAEKIEDAAANSNISKDVNPLRSSSSVSPQQVYTKSTISNVGSSYVNTGKSGNSSYADPMGEQLDVVALWINDPTPTQKTRIKLNDAGKAVKKLIRHPETNDIQFDTSGHDIIQTPFGPLHQPNLQPQTEDVTEEYIVKKYKNRRHIVYIPKDGIILHDVDWTLPIPLVCQRDNFALDGYWTTGLALRLGKLTSARNIILTMMVQKTKFSMSGTFLASTRSGIKANKLTPKPGEVFVANMIDETNFKRFPVEPLDGTMLSLLGQIETEMLKILNISPVQQGQAVGRVDGADTYQKLLEASSDNVQALSLFIEDTITEIVKIQLAYIQAYYTHDHLVEIETSDGMGTQWKAASSLATRGDYAIKVEIGVGNNHSESAMFARNMQFYSMGIYTLPTFCRLANIPQWRKALQIKGELVKNPNMGYLLGASAAPPATQAKAASSAAAGKRSHHGIK